MLRAVLRTPLHPTVSRRFMLLTRVGDDAVSPPVPLRYAVHEGTTIVMARSWTTWWTALSADTPTTCTVTLKGRSTTVQALLATGEAMDEAILRYLQKYPGEWKKLGIDAQATADQVEEAARGQVVITFTSA